MEKRKGLKDAIAAKGLIQVMAAHSPLCARLAEEAGFDGLWASGFELSALYGLADASLISMTQHLEMVRAMSAQSSLPIVADIDTGFGNAINVIYAVAQYERAGAAAIVIEDKTFPKATSLFPGARQELLRVEEFQGKIEAAVHARKNGDFSVIARTEALIAGKGKSEALKRAAAYEEAGADMILFHSKQKTPEEIECVVRDWSGAAPIVLVPTTYPDMTEARARALGKVQMLIYGNHAIRASVAGMQQAFAEIIAGKSAREIEQKIASVEEIFRLQHMDEIEAQEQSFLR